MIGAAVDATVYRVKQFTTPPASPDGSSWANAFPSIDAAFAAVTFTANDELWVAASGATPYHPTQGGTPSDPRLVHYEISLNDFTLKGGFPHDPPNGSEERDVAANPTVLSGDLEDDDPPFDPNEEMNPDAEDEELVGNPLTHDPMGNAYHVFEVIGVDDTCVIDGFVIRDGYDWDGLTPPVNGPGYAGVGGAMHLTSATPGKFAAPYIQNCKFFDNFASLDGGAIAAIASKIVHTGESEGPYEDPADYDSELKIRTCEFRGNWAGRGSGAAIAVSRGGLDVAGTLVADNRANTYAGGIFVEFPNPLRVTNCTITNNRSLASNPGGVVIETLLWQVETAGLFVVRNSIVSGNFDSQPSGRFSNQVKDAGVFGLEPEVDFSIIYEINDSYGEGNQSTLTEFPDFFFDSDNADVFARDYRVAMTSWCVTPIDRGDPESSNLPEDERDADDDGNFFEELPDVRLGERLLAGPWGGCPRVDVGAYEMGDPEFSIVCVGDFDLDGSIGAGDLAILLGGWVQPEEGVAGIDTSPCHLECCPADLDGDGWVDSVDLAILLGSWGPCSLQSCSEPSPLTGSSGGNSGMLSPVGGLTMTPAELGALLGFESLDAFAEWLGSLSPESREAVLAVLTVAGGGM